MQRDLIVVNDNEISLHFKPMSLTTMRSHCILSLWDSFLWITVSSFLTFCYLLV